MKHLLIISLIALMNCLSISRSYSQADSTFSIIRNGQEAKFPFAKFTKIEQLRAVPNSSLPLYSFNKTQYSRIKGLLSSFVQIENDYRQLLKNRNDKDSVHIIKETTLSEGLKLQEERAKNFQTSYNSLLSVNTQLNDQLKKTEQLAIHEHKKRKLNSILLGVLALSAGVVIGVTVR